MTPLTAAATDNGRKKICGRLAAVAIVMLLQYQSFRFAQAQSCYLARNIANGYGMYLNVAVARMEALDLLTVDGQVTSVVSPEFRDLTGVAYDRAKEQLYLTDASHPNGSVFQMDLGNSHLKTILPNQTVHVQSVAFDPESTTLYWTDDFGRTISMMHLADNNPTVPQTLHKFQNEIPMGITVDSCARLLYWTNSYHKKPSIERSALDGSNKEVIIKDNLFQPLGITVDQPTNKLYWSDDTDGIFYKIEFSDLDGRNRKIVYQGTHQKPVAVTVGPNYIFWSDWVYRAVWSLPKNNPTQEPKMVKSYKDHAPMGLVAQIAVECSNIEFPTTVGNTVNVSSSREMNDATAVTPVVLPKNCDGNCEVSCFNKGVLKENLECECPPGFRGQRCEIPVCFSYCVHGSCYVDVKGFPQCKCQLGYKGDRCHIDVCQTYCLNGGRCSLGEGGEPICMCDKQFRGQRCERGRNYLASYEPYVISDNVENVTSSIIIRNNVTAQPLCSSQELNEVIFVTVGAVILIQFVIISLLVRKICILRKRPRIKKRIIVNKNVTPLTSRPPQQGEQCEITIENCCNMNICETPCFEPQLRTSKMLSKTEEKKNLLGSMEEPQNCSPCQDLY